MKRMLAVMLTAGVLHSWIALAEENHPRGASHITGFASWYSKMDRGIRRTTANMERFSDRKHTCAIWGFPFNSLVRVTNMMNGKSIVVRVNDRGPARRFVRQGRVIDLTKSAFLQIADLDDGLIPIKVSMLSSG